MALSTGTKLESYEIVSSLGAGGMGEVYRARDSRLDRDVALKVLPEAFARDPERMLRFQREAKMLASLNHPNIAGVYGFEEADGNRFLVMELVEGVTLADRIKAGPIPVDEALDICKQIAQALEAAHESGVIHRDLKPANVQITPDGKVKVLDFGLAKAFCGDERSQTDIINSPTITANYTKPGVVLGTAAYMSPEQARGKSLDKRTDIWAFGCVLYETLGGSRPFDGETVSDMIAKILERDPDFSTLPSNTPVAIRNLLHHCLEKDVKRRLRDIGDAVIELEEAISTRAWSTAAMQAATSLPTLQRRRAGTAVAALLLVAGGVAIGAALSRRPIDAGIRQVSRTTIPLPENAPLNLGRGGSLAISPDGKRIAYRTRSGITSPIMVRELDGFEFQQLSGTDYASEIFFSPDGKWVGFTNWSDPQRDRRGVYKYSLVGGFSTKILPERAMGPGWCSDGNVYYGEQRGRWLSRISADGGEVSRLVKSPASGPRIFPAYPQLLPGGTWLVYTELQFPIQFGQLRIVAYSTRTAEEREVFLGGVFLGYLPSGHVLIGQGQRVLAAPFDVESAGIVGEPVEVLDKVWLRAFDVSATGTLVYMASTGDSRAGLMPMVVNRNGQETDLPMESGRPIEPRISPDGRRMVFVKPGSAGAAAGIWMYDIELDRASRVTDQGVCFNPVWAPDGKRVAFNVGDEGQNLFIADVDDLGDAVRVTDVNRRQYPADWSRDGRWLLWCEGGDTVGDIWMMDVQAALEQSGPDRDAEPSITGDTPTTQRIDKTHSLHGVRAQPLFVTDAVEKSPSLSPDGRWVAFVSNRSGRDEVYVTSFPEPRRFIPVSPQGGMAPVWSPSTDQPELFFQLGDTLMVVKATGSGTLSFSRPEEVLSGAYRWNSSVDTPRSYDVLPDGQSFLFLKPFVAGNDREIRVVQNWLEELKAKVPIAR